MRKNTLFLISLFYTPSQTARDIFYQIVRAGWLKAANDYRIERRSCPGDDLLFCLAGKGFVMIQGQTYAVSAGQVVWIDGYHPHAHWADKNHPWELLWLRWRAPWMDATGRVLEVNTKPVFPKIDQRKLKRIFHRVFELMAKKPLALEAFLHAESANLLTCLFEARLSEQDDGPTRVKEVRAELREAFTQMSLYPQRSWRLSQLAGLAHLSVPHFCRRFREEFDCAPIDWLRRERINHAKHRLLECDDSIKEISEQVGYNDAFYFSRDFKRHTGFSPSEYRRKAHGEKDWPY